jgi:hypothetical protein
LLTSNVVTDGGYGGVMQRSSVLLIHVVYTEALPANLHFRNSSLGINSDPNTLTVVLPHVGPVIGKTRVTFAVASS